MHPPPRFSMAPNWVQTNILWIYWLIVYWGCSSRPALIIKKFSLLQQNHWCVQPFSFQMAQYFFELYDNFPKSGFHHLGLCWLLLLDSHSQLSIALGETKWRHVSQNMRSVLHVEHTVRVHVLVRLNSHQVANIDMTTTVLTVVVKLEYSIFYNRLINVKSEKVGVDELWDPWLARPKREPVLLRPMSKVSAWNIRWSWDTLQK